MKMLIPLIEDIESINFQSFGTLTGHHQIISVVVISLMTGVSKTGGKPLKAGGLSGMEWSSSSGWNSTGLGLQYVTMVVRNLGGKFVIEDLPDGGARTAIVLEKNAAGKESSKAGREAFGM